MKFLTRPSGGGLQVLQRSALAGFAVGTGIHRIGRLPFLQTRRHDAGHRLLASAIATQHLKEEGFQCEQGRKYSRAIANGVLDNIG